METTENKEVLSSADQQSLDKFNEMKASIDEQVENLSSLKVTDENSLAIANHQLSKGKQIVKQIDAAHATTKEPALRFCQAVDKARKELRTPLDNAMALAERGVLNYNAEVQRKKQEELAALEMKQQQEREKALKEAQELQSKMIAFEKEAFEKIDSSKSEAELSEIYKLYVLNFPNNYDKIIIGRISKLGKARIDVIRNIISDEQYIAVKSEIMGIKVEVAAPVVDTPQFDAIEVKKEAIMNSGPTNIKKKWNFEVIDEASVPRIFLSVDESKVKAYIKGSSEKGEIKEGVLNGIRFYQESTLKIK